MKIKALAALCSKVKSIALYDDGDRQWAGDGYAAYLLPEAFGTMSIGALTAVFDIPCDKAADMLTRRTDMPESYDTQDDGDGEEELIFDTDSRILHAGRELLPCWTQSGMVYLIQAKYLKPILDSEGLRLSVRHMDGDGMPYITAKDGMFLTAIISPVKTGDPLHQWLCSLYNGIIRAHVYEDGGEE